jgi:hypothetical protein
MQDAVICPQKPPLDPPCTTGGLFPVPEDQPVEFVSSEGEQTVRLRHALRKLYKAHYGVAASQ